MIKKIFVLFVITTLIGCGYNPIFSNKKNSNLVVKNFQVIGDKELNRKIISTLNLKKNDADESKFSLMINSEKKLDIVSKDKTGNASVYRTTILVKLSLNEENKIIKSKDFSSSFTYNNIENKFDLTQYQKSIELNLINKISEEIFIFLKL